VGFVKLSVYRFTLSKNMTHCTIFFSVMHIFFNNFIQIDPSNIPSNVHLNYGTNSVAVDIQNFQSKNDGDYQCFVHNSVGNDVRVVHLRGQR
jgi:hypothetical protein